MTKKVLIIGGGFAGINLARSLKKSNFEILLLDKTNHHLFQPLLYQVASAALSPSNIAVPLRQILKNQKNATVIMANVIAIDKNKQLVLTASGEAFSYDYLVIATGTTHSYFGHDEWEGYAPGLKTLIDAVSIREKILLAFEKAERCEDPLKLHKYLRFVVIGGGPTGVEMAGAIAEISRKTLFNNFRNIRPELSEIYLIEGLPHVLPSYPLDLALKAEKSLEKMGVKIVTNTRVTDINDQGVFIGERLIETSNIIWAAGNQAGSLLKTLETPLDNQGRVVVKPDCSIPEYPNIFCIGDCANFSDGNGGSLPGIAPVAIQQGKYLAKLLKSNQSPEKRRGFKYFDKGTMATIGKAKAVAVIGKLKLSGFIAWLMWGLIHIVYLISFSNRLLVMIQWGYIYLTGKRSARLITRPVFDDDPYLLEKWEAATMASLFNDKTKNSKE